MPHVWKRGLIVLLLFQVLAVTLASHRAVVALLWADQRSVCTQRVACSRLAPDSPCHNIAKAAYFLPPANAAVVVRLVRLRAFEIL